MKKIFLFLTLICLTKSIAQLNYVNDFKKNSYDLYEMTFKDPISAIHKYNYVLDKNGSDTTEVVYDITKNPIDFGFFSNDRDSDNIIVSIFLRDNNKYKIMFGEIDGTKDKRFFWVIDENGMPTDLVYKKDKN